MEYYCIYVESENIYWYRQSYLQSRNKDTDAENMWIPRGDWGELGDWD